MIKCVKCHKEINCEDGYYNYPSGAMHTLCGEAKNEEIGKLVRSLWNR